MKASRVVIGAFTSVLAVAQVPEVQPRVTGRSLQEGKVTVVYLAPRFATAIRMPDAINSAVLGDPDSFSAEHSDREPQVVFVKPITEKIAQSNLIISTVRGFQANLLLISRGQSDTGRSDVDLMVRYRPDHKFIIEPSRPSALIAQTAVLPTAPDTTDPPATSTGDPSRGSIEHTAFRDAKTDAHAEAQASSLDALLDRQRRAPLPTLYGENPSVAAPGKEILKAGVSEVIDEGRDVVVLFSVVNVQDHAIQLMPPQVQLAGKVTKGRIVRHKVWTNSEQLLVEEFLMSRRRIGPNERADGVLVFQRPSFKQSSETLLLQMADSGAVDRPALAPIGFGISRIQHGGGE
jgi:hypothetical protein